MKKKILSVFLTIVMCLSLVASLNVTVSAASLPTISKNKPLITYTYSSTGKVYAYKEASLKNKTGGYIACATDECKIIEINGDAVKVTYPVPGDTKTAWFSREAFTYRDLAKDGAQKPFTAQVGVTTYRWKNNYTKMGSVSKNDNCYLLRGKETSDWVQIIYPVTGGHKMAWVTGSDYCKMIGAKTEETKTTAGLISPIKSGMVVTGSSASTHGYKCDYKASSGTPIYAPADGTVKFKQTSYNGKLISYGNWVEFTSSDKVYYIKMGHLNSFNNVPLLIPSSKSARISASDVRGEVTKTLDTRTVKQGDLLGYSGEVGNAYGAHLHVEVKKNNSWINPATAFSAWN